MAKLAEIKGNFESAKEKLKSVLSMNQHNEDAILLLANLCSDHKDSKTAITELKLFTKANPYNLKILIELFQLLRRTGKIDQIKPLMTETQKFIQNPINSINNTKFNINTMSAGMHYLRAYVLWYLDNEAVAAIDELNPVCFQLVDILLLN